MDSSLISEISKHCEDEFDVRMTENNVRNNRYFLCFHIMDIINTDKLDEMTTYLESTTMKSGAKWSGWYEGKFEIIY